MVSVRRPSFSMKQPAISAAIAASQLGQRKRGGGVAGHHHQIWFGVGDGPAEHAGDSLDQIFLDQVAVGKPGIICQIYETRIGSRGLHLSEHREAAEPGIENKNGRGRCHVTP